MFFHTEFSWLTEKGKIKSVTPESEFNEFEPRLKSAKNHFQIITGLNIETLITILSVTNHI